MSSKSALKAVRTALDSKDFEAAEEKAKALVKQEPKNYHAYAPILLWFIVAANMIYLRNVFLGLAQDKLNKNADAEQAYLGATRVKDNDKTAWQGLVSLYEKQGSHKLEPYRQVVLRLGEIFAEAYVTVIVDLLPMRY